MKTVFRYAPLVAALAAGPALALDLLQSYDAALEQDATVRAARAAAESGRERLPQARAQLMPNLALSASRNHNDLDRTSAPTAPATQDRYYSYNQSLTLRQPLYRPQQAAAYDQAGYLVADAEATLDRELKNLGVRVVTAYLEALLADDQLALVATQQRVTTALVDAARKAFAAGSGTRTDVDEAQARLDMVIAQELEVRQNRDQVRRQLQVIVNQPVTALAALDVTRLRLEPPQPASLDDWVSRAEAGSPELAALRARLEAARLEVRKAESGHQPTLDLVLQATRSGSESVTSPSSGYINRSVGWQLSLPLYAGGYASSVVRQALAEQQRAEEQLEAARRDLGVRVHKEYRGVTEGVLRIRALEQAVRSGEQMVTSNRRSFEAGVRTRMDILNAEQELQTARRDLAQARYRYLISKVQLLALAGGDMRALSAEINGWLQP